MKTESTNVAMSNNEISMETYDSIMEMVESPEICVEIFRIIRREKQASLDMGYANCTKALLSNESTFESKTISDQITSMKEDMEYFYRKYKECEISKEKHQRFLQYKMMVEIIQVYIKAREK
jgi:hypothetical protein